MSIVNDVTPAGLVCPHCGADVADVTYIEVGNTEHVTGPTGMKWTAQPEPVSVTVYYQYECGGETGYYFESGKDVVRYDGETENQCPMLGVS